MEDRRAVPRATWMASSSLRPASTRLGASTGANGDEANWWTAGSAASADSWLTVGLVAGGLQHADGLGAGLDGDRDRRAGGPRRPRCPTTASTSAGEGGARAAAGRACSWPVVGVGGGPTVVRDGQDQREPQLLGGRRQLRCRSRWVVMPPTVWPVVVFDQFDPDRVHARRIEPALFGDGGEVDGEPAGGAVSASGRPAPGRERVKPPSAAGGSPLTGSGAWWRRWGSPVGRRPSTDWLKPETLDRQG